MVDNIKINSIFEEGLNKEVIKRKFLQINDKNGIRWLIEDNNSISSILHQWRPYKIINLIFWKFFLFLLKLRIAEILPLIKTRYLTTSLKFKNLNLKIRPENILISCYFGRKTEANHKAIIFIFNQKKNKCVFVIKKAMNYKSWESIKKEYQILNKLKKDKNKYIPKVLNLNASNKAFVQEYIDGKPSSIYLRETHYLMLATLINKDKFLKLKKFKKVVIDFYNLIKIAKFADKNFLNEIYDLISSKVWDQNVQTVRIHGDFTPWNLKFTKDTNKLVAYDWEYSLDSYLPFYDLLFYKYSVKKLLKKKIKVNKMKYVNYLYSKGYSLNNNLIEKVFLISEIVVLTKLKMYAK